MKNSTVLIINVYYQSGSTKMLMGRLARKNHKIFFEYDTAFIKTGIELSPFKLPLKSGVISTNDSIFEGLFGIFNDSLPDGWGRLLLDRTLVKRGINPHDISPLERLCYVGNNGMGALSLDNAWTLSPAYDLTFSSGPSGEHCSTIMGEGKNPTQLPLLRLAEIGNITKQGALEIIDDIKSAASKWVETAKNVGVTKRSTNLINQYLHNLQS